ncbi:hypothetical protein [Yoonia sp.]|uniref:hypothetical protein n=1 Tax=Yoonia sp. TaxID=2212373 RepID=UPI002FDA3CCE
MNAFTRSGRRMIRLFRNPKVDQLLKIYHRAGGAMRQAAFDNLGLHHTHWRIVDPENLTTYTSLDLQTPWQLELAAKAPPALLKKRSLHLLDATWHFHSIDLSTYKALFERVARTTPLAKFVIIARTPFCAYRLGQAGIGAIQANSSAFEDDRAWSIEEPPSGGAPRYEAIYNARLLDWKNHHLTKALKNQLFVYEHPGQDSDLVHGFRKDFPNACFANHDLNDGIYRYFDEKDLSRLLADAHVSLALSFKEGFMRASLQSLLAGKPVVTVENIGGRSRFYHDDTALFVAPTPEAVKAGVHVLKERRLSPEFVRREAMKLLQIERRDVMESINGIRGDVFGPTARTLDFEAFRGIKFRRAPVLDFWQALEQAVG